MADITQQQDSRRIFIDTLAELNDSKNIIITCDVGFNYLNQDKTKVFNLGVTEQSSTIIATTMALSGFTVWLYSMINFVTFRVHEAVRNGICLHNANVKIVGVRGSEKYKFLGFSHNLLWDNEEIEWLEKLPNIKCHVPKLDEVKQTILEEYSRKGPAYIRL